MSSKLYLPTADHEYFLISCKPRLAQLGGNFYDRDRDTSDDRGRGTLRGLRSSISVGSSPRHKRVYTLLGHRLGWRPATHRQLSQRTPPALEDCAFEPQLVNGIMPLCRVLRGGDTPCIIREEARDAIYKNETDCRLVPIIK